MKPNNIHHRVRRRQCVPVHFEPTHPMVIAIDIAETFTDLPPAAKSILAAWAAEEFRLRALMEAGSICRPKHFLFITQTINNIPEKT